MTLINKVLKKIQYKLNYTNLDKDIYHYNKIEDPSKKKK